MIIFIKYLLSKNITKNFNLIYRVRTNHLKLVQIFFIYTEENLEEQLESKAGDSIKFFRKKHF